MSLNPALIFILLSTIIYSGAFFGGVISFFTPKENYSKIHKYVEIFLFLAIILTAIFFAIEKSIISMILLTILAIVFIFFLRQFFEDYKQVLYVFLAPVLFLAFRSGNAHIFAPLIFGLFITSAAQLKRNTISTVFSDVAINYSLFLVTALLINLFSLGFV